MVPSAPALPNPLEDTAPAMSELLGGWSILWRRGSPASAPASCGVWQRGCAACTCAQLHAVLEFRAAWRPAKALCAHRRASVVQNAWSRALCTAEPFCQRSQLAGANAGLAPPLQRLSSSPQLAPSWYHVLQGAGSGRQKECLLLLLPLPPQRQAQGQQGGWGTERRWAAWCSPVPTITLPLRRRLHLHLLATSAP